MQLQNFQLLLAKIYTDETFRRDFFKNPEIFAEKYQISEENLQTLAQQYQQEIDIFSKTLINKRLYALKNMLPNTWEILETLEKGKTRFYFEKFCQKNTLFSENRYTQDAFEFGFFLKENDFFQENLSQKQRLHIQIEYKSLRTQKPFLRWILNKEVFFLHIHFFGKYFLRTFFFKK